MKRFGFLLVVMLAATLTRAADVSCQLPKKALVDGFTYTCDNAEQQIVWGVIYYQKQLWVSVIYPDSGLVAHVPAVFRNYRQDFYSTEPPEQVLHLWLTKDATGQWITLLGQ